VKFAAPTKSDLKSFLEISAKETVKDFIQSPVRAL